MHLPIQIVKLKFSSMVKLWVLKNYANSWILKKRNGDISASGIQECGQEGCDEVMKNFGEKYRELGVKPNGKNTVEVLYMGNQSNARL